MAKEFKIYELILKGPDFEKSLKEEIKNIDENKDANEDANAVFIFIKAKDLKLKIAQKITEIIISLFNPDVECKWVTKLYDDLENKIIIQMAVV